MYIEISGFIYLQLSQTESWNLLSRYDTANFFWHSSQVGRSSGMGGANGEWINQFNELRHTIRTIFILVLTILFNRLCIVVTMRLFIIQNVPSISVPLGSSRWSRSHVTRSRFSR